MKGASVQRGSLVELRSLAEVHEVTNTSIEVGGEVAVDVKREGSIDWLGTRVNTFTMPTSQCEDS